MAKVVSVTNHKGGVGKTTTVAAIGSALEKEGKKVLLIDLDPQANLTASLCATAAPRYMADSMKEGENLPIINIRRGLSLAPADYELAGVEANKCDIETLKKLIKPVERKFDVILIDCPPSLGILTFNALVASNFVIIPLTAEALPFGGIAKITEAIDGAMSEFGAKVELLGILFTRWEGRRLNKMVEETLRDTFGEKVFNTRIRTNISIAEAPLQREDIITYSPNSNGAKDYSELTKEIIKRLCI